ncbi:MAG: rane-associated protein [Pseudonocardiales bacterium]|nr:rane-associated protein [Pseudonocardiales bacterium]
MPHMLLALNLLDSRSLIDSFGIIGIFAVLFAETGLLIGVFLPGDSLLFTAGLLTSTTGAVSLPLPGVLLAAVAGALLGAQLGYLLGRRAAAALHSPRRGPRTVTAMTRAAGLLQHYGHRRAVVIARFIPVVRTVLSPVAGALGVPPRTFALWQTVGGLLWTVGLILAGHALGASVPNVDRYLLPAISAIVVLSLIPVALEIARARRAGRV